MALANTKNSIKTLIETSPSYLTSYLIDFRPGPDTTGSVKQYLEECRQVIFARMEEALAPARIVRLQSLMMDRLIVGLFKMGFEESQAHGVLPVPLALFALGGYGRAELNLYSDLDLLFLYQGKAGPQIEFITKKMLYPLWDSQVEIGYAIRTIADCKKVMKEDARTMSSMLDARFLAGDRELAEKFMTFLEAEFSSSKALKNFVEIKNREMKERLKRFGGSVYVLEPNLKESEGGLRDWHMLRYYARIALKTADQEEWVRRGLLKEEELDLLGRALDFLWDVRNRLHRLSKGNQDQLSFEFQEAIAGQLGFETGGGTLAVEKFMQAYYTHAANLHRLLVEVTRNLMKPYEPALSRLKRRLKTSLDANFLVVDGKIHPKNYIDLEKHPVEFTRAFYLAQKHRLQLDEDFKSWISRHLYLIDDSYRKNPEVAGMFREMLLDISGIGKSLLEMHDSRFLGVILPEFGDILFQTQHDIYHVYTVDTHSILAVDELSKLKNGDYDQEFPLFKKALEEVQGSGVLTLGVLFHDIGKGKGGNHSERGAEIAQVITRRLAYPDEERSEVEFLVRSHLLMPHLSQRRDLSDANMIAQFARSMGTLERLNMLFILTWADIRAVGPDVWTPWKGALLSELYTKTRKILDSKEHSPEKAADIMKQLKAEVLKQAGGGADFEDLKIYIDSMPPRYFLTNDVAVILQHFRSAKDLPGEGFIFENSVDPRDHVNRLLIFTLNTPRLFEQVTGVMAANQVNILAFEQFFSSKGEALLLLKVSDQRGQLIEEDRRILALQQDLQEVLRGRVSMEKYSRMHQGQLFFLKKVAQAKPPRVDVDNDVSAYYTVIDIYANDRIGLLHDLARAMTQLGLYIEVSKISTKVDQVADVFYVRDIFRHKITDSKKVATIKKTLLEVLTE